MASQTAAFTEEMAVNFRGRDSLPPARCVYNHTLIHYMGNVAGKNVLEVGCGEGRLCRLIKSKGASRVLGIDLSPLMINFAKEDDEKANIHCEYQVGDARQLEKISEFDIVALVNVFHFAKTTADLTNMCRGFYQNLKPGGLFYGIAFNVYCDMDRGHTLKKYGYETLALLPKDRESRPLKIVGVKVCEERPPIVATGYLFEPEEYEKAFIAAGFRSVEYRPVIVDESLIPEYPDGFWDLFLENPTHICYIAQK